MSESLTRLSDVLMPPVCLGCQCPMQDHHALCPECWQQVTFISAPLCDRLGLPMPYDTGGTMISAAAAREPPAYNRARAVAHYDGKARHLIHDFKFRDQHNARQLFARWLVMAGQTLLNDADVIVPVPLYRFRLLNRRFNQAAILAKTLSQLTSITHHPLVLRRTRPTKRQVGLTTAQRKENVRGAFSVPDRKRALIEGRNILLIDDVITTGATINACAKTLKKAGAVRVDVLALALVTGFETLTP